MGAKNEENNISSNFDQRSMFVPKNETGHDCIYRLYNIFGLRDRLYYVHKLA